MPLVSVIIPAYNAERFIDQCVDSVLSQTLSDIEIIVVDDGSTDATFELANAKAQIDSRLTVLSQNNLYAGTARNEGMKHATGKYLYFLDADDYITPDALSVMTSFARSHHADVVVCKSDYYDNQTGEITPIDFAMQDVPTMVPLSQSQIASRLFHSFVGWPWDKLFRRNFVLAKQLTFQSLRTSNDAQFVFCALASANTVYCVDNRLVYHRTNNNSSLEKTRTKSYENALLAIEGVHDTLVRLNRFEDCSRSYLNWVVNFIRWNISTLDTSSAQSLYERAQELLLEIPVDECFFFDREDYYFQHYNNLSYAQLLALASKYKVLSDSLNSDIQRLNDNYRKELDGLKERNINLQVTNQSYLSTIESLKQEKNHILESYSYRLGHTLLQPIRKLRKHKK